MPSSAAESLCALSSWKIFPLLPLCLMVLCAVVLLGMFENLVKYEKKTKKSLKQFFSSTPPSLRAFLPQTKVLTILNNNNKKKW